MYLLLNYYFNNKNVNLVRGCINTCKTARFYFRNELNIPKYPTFKVSNLFSNPRSIWSFQLEISFSLSAICNTETRIQQFYGKQDDRRPETKTLQLIQSNDFLSFIMLGQILLNLEQFVEFPYCFSDSIVQGLLNIPDFQCIVNQIFPFSDI